MTQNVTCIEKQIKSKPRTLSAVNRIFKEPWLYIMMLPGIIYYIIFKYIPMWGVVFAFQNYSPYKGVLHSEWVGFAHFIRFFSEGTFWLLMRNTLWFAVLNLVFFFPLPIILSLMLNEVRKVHFKRAIQTLVYLPHFFSWVVIVGISYTFLSTDNGLVNDIIKSFGGEPINFMMNPVLFRPLITLEIIWKECGWGTIIFLAALAGIDVEQYEAAIIDGANRWQQMLNITLPAIRSTIVILLILRMGHFLDTGFEQIFLMISATTRDVGEVFDTYIYTNGVQGAQFSYTTAIGIFKSVVGLILIFATNKLAQRYGEEGIY